jgi:hypothetical protein
MRKQVKKTERTTMKLSDLNAAAYNPRKIDGKAMAGLRESLDRFGLVQDIVVNRRNKTIVGGHQRAQALRDAGVEDVPVTLVDLDEPDEKALNIALNNPHIAGEFNDTLDALLAEVRAEIGAPDFAALNLEDLFPPEVQAIEPETNPYDEWEGMPEYEAKDPCFRKVVVNFDDAEAVQNFFDMIGQDFTDKTKSIWHPKKERRDMAALEYAEGEGDDDA